MPVADTIDLLLIAAMILKDRINEIERNGEVVRKD